MKSNLIAGGAAAGAIAAMLLMGAGIGGETPAAAQSAGDSKCAALAEIKTPGMTIESAALQPATAPVKGANSPSMRGEYGKGAPIAGLPAFCRVIGSLSAEAGSDIKFEAWLPQSGWTGRYTGANSGGLAGFINYLDLAAAVKAGQATSGSDTGHVGDTPGDGRWAKGNSAKIKDYGWRAVHLTTVAGKQLAEAYYGRKPDKSYFVGCSNGGRQGLMEAARYPEDYDGIVVGAPAVGMTDLAVTLLNADHAQNPPGAALDANDVRTIQSEVIKQCDAVDGLTDGLVADPRQCRVDYAKLGLSAAKTAAVKQIVGGVTARNGRKIADGYPLTGGEIGKPVAQFGWDGNAVLRFRNGDQPNFAETILENFTVPPVATSATFDFNRDPQRLKAAVGGEIDTQPNLTKFFARGGKMILWHGWSDAHISPLNSIAYFEAVAKRMGKARRDAAVRLFMLPGMGHCAGGDGPSDFPALAALMGWVEGGKAPEVLIARRADKSRTRPVYAWPATARYVGSSSIDEAASFRLGVGK